MDWVKYFTIDNNDLSLKINDNFHNAYCDRFIDGKISHIGYCTNGIKHGPSYQFNEKGQIINKENYVFNKLQGIQYQWYNNGHIHAIENYVNNVDSIGGIDDEYYHSSQYQWYRNGQIHSIKNCNYGELHGWQYQWYRNGQIFDMKKYCNNRCHGLHYRWYETGPLYNIQSYLNDELDGMQYKWHENGQICCMEQYVNDKKTDNMHYYWDDNGKFGYTPEHHKYHHIHITYLFNNDIYDDVNDYIDNLDEI